ncbi:MAG: HEAT repeat domain-containing protein, partial [Bdellovibrionales bacterium]|nr:HEAT repeat domain-containing protein [Bdellovibrionales bacterium]
MDAQSAHNQIHNAIDSLEQNLADSHHAYEFLKDLPGDYRVGIDALRDGLDSKSQDVQLVCVLAIGRLGRGSEWALNAIAEIAEDSNMHVMVRSAAYFAISSLETPEAANKLAKVLEAALENDWDQSRASDALRALALMGGLAVEHRGLFFRAWNKVKDLEGSFASFEVASAYGKFLNQLKTDYYHYVKLGLSFNLKLDNLTEGNPRDLDCDKIIKQFGSWNLIQDQYFVYSRDNTAQRQALPDRLGMFLGLAPLAMRTLIFQHESGDIAACGCLDEFSLGSSVINKFEVFAETLSNAFQLDPSKVQWCTHTRDSRDSSLIGIMNPVSFRITDGETRIRHVSWGRGPDLAEYFGDAF